MLRRILFSLVGLLALLLAAEVGVTLLAQRGMRGALRSQYGIPPDLEVSIDSFPCIAALLRNRLAEVMLVWTEELPYRRGDGGTGTLGCRARVSLYDMELSMPSLLRGKLEARRISRQKAGLAMELRGLEGALGLAEGSLHAEGDALMLSRDGVKTRCVIKVVGEGGVALSPREAYTPSSTSETDPELLLEEIIFPSLPMGARILNASVEGVSLLLEISRPMWEGYL